ncbi:MAG: hypothetical protein A3J79_04710 [Elusimicrobia bacterium RIFOXYB2_FULL_62_6]|nr:MAG: hypothetical protein A3J79_04710 [Elusimicrobia bacterium RIFOXYB2_FULL_62_6]
MSHTEELEKMEPGFGLDEAVAEAQRCLLCHDAPCSKACPAGTDPGAFIRKLRLRNLTGAIRTIRENNILGGSCGVLCPASRLCEKECSATGIDRPVRIAKLQRFLIEHAWKTGFKVLEKPAGPAKDKVAVVGAGPAGLSCAAELARRGYRVTVFEAPPEPGGVLRYGVPAFRLNAEFLNKDLAELETLGVDFKFSAPLEGLGAVERLLDDHKAVFIAIGAWKPLRLNAHQKEIKGLFTSVEFLAALRQGSEETLFAGKFSEAAKAVRGKTCAVIGGGSVAMDCARSALKLGAKDVYVLYRRSYSQMPAEEDEKQAAMNEGAHFLLLNQPVDYIADKDGHLKGIKLVRTQLGGKDPSGRRKPVEIRESGWTLEAQCAIEAIGNAPDDKARKLYPSIAVNKGGLILADEKHGRTTGRGVFAGGDIVRGPDLVVRAVRDGKTAAAAIADYLEKKRVKQIITRKPGTVPFTGEQSER